MPTPAVPRLVAEAEIRTVNGDQEFYLPVTIAGRRVTVLLDFVDTHDLALQLDRLNKLGINTAAPPDSVTIGTVVEPLQDVAAITGAFEQDQPGLPPLVGSLGHPLLVHYDVVIDGPAHRVRLYARTSPSATKPADAPWLPPGVPAANCTPFVPMPDQITGFAIHAAGNAITAILETRASYTKMNMVAAQVLGLTQQSSNVHPLPDEVWEKQDGAGHPVKYEVTGLPLRLGTQAFTDVPVHIFPELGIDRKSTPVPPTILLTPQNLEHQILVVSNSTGRICLGAAPRAGR